jgi:hypothetical protein
MSFKRAKVVMLPAKEQKTNIELGLEGGGLYLNNKGYIDEKTEYQHLYITSNPLFGNDDIEKGSWVFNFEYDYITQYDSERHDDKFWFRKIIATTDTSLKTGISKGYIGKEYSLPQPSESFIKVFVDGYNKGNTITDVLVEYEGQYRTNDDGEPNRVKVNPKDTTITIKKVKDSWNREEVIELIKCFDRGINRPITNVNKWIEENL